MKETRSARDFANIVYRLTVQSLLNGLPAMDASGNIAVVYCIQLFLKSISSSLYLAVLSVCMKTLLGTSHNSALLVSSHHQKSHRNSKNNHWRASSCICSAFQETIIIRRNIFDGNWGALVFVHGVLLMEFLCELMMIVVRAAWLNATIFFVVN